MSLLIRLTFAISSPRRGPSPPRKHRPAMIATVITQHSTTPSLPTLSHASSLIASSNAIHHPRFRFSPALRRDTLPMATGYTSSN